MFEYLVGILLLLPNERLLSIDEVVVQLLLLHATLICKIKEASTYLGRILGMTIRLGIVTKNTTQDQKKSSEEADR